MKKVYLAGGFKSKWQVPVAERLLGRYVSLDPSAHGIQDPAVYTEWDLAAIRDCDIVLANMEASNPGGYALALEIGYARALNKRVIFVDQIDDAKIRRYFDMVIQCADTVHKSLDAAVDELLENVPRE